MMPYIKIQIAVLSLACILFINLTGNCLAEIRISFLDHAQALEETLTLLLKHGCQKDSVAGFKAAVADYYKAPNPCDTPRFPVEREGFYYFIDVKDLLNRMDGNMGNGKGNGRPSINCSGAVALLMNNMGLSAVNVIINLTKEGVADYPSTEHNFIIGVSEERNRIFKLTNVQIRTNDYQAAVSLFAPRFVPVPTSGKTDAEKLFTLQVERWKADELHWHPAIGIVAVHMYESVTPSEKQILLWRDHLGLCFKDAGRVILIEKTSLTGPFLRGDFNSEDELAEFLIGAVLKPSLGIERKKDLRHFLISINDRLIRSYNLPEKEVQNKDSSNKVSHVIVPVPKPER